MKEREPIATTNPAEIEALITRVEGGETRTGDAQLIGRLLRLMLVLLRILENKNASLARLKRLLFGPTSERRVKPEAQEQQASLHTVTSSQPAQGEITDGEPRSEPFARRSSVEPEAVTERKTRLGHGRLGANAYVGAQTVRCADPTLEPGDQCPHRLCPGHLYDTRAPQIFIRLKGCPVVEATR